VKVLHLINTLSAGGAELHLLTLCRYLKRREISLRVACLREQVKGSRSLRADFEKEGIRVINLEVDSRYDVRLFSKVAGILRKEQPDILHSHLPRADLAGAFACFFYPSVAWVSSVHGIYDDAWSGRWTLPLFNFLWRQSDGVVAISRAVKNWLVTRRIPQEKIKVIHYGIEPERFRRSDPSRQNQWSVNRRPVIGSIGRLEPGKGHDCLIEAMPTILEQRPDASLLIAGHDPWGYGKNLREDIERLKLEKKVQLLGFQNDVCSFLGALDVFAFASRSEGFGQVVIEAMAAGKPVVASKIPPLTEIIEDGETGLLVEPGDARGFANAIVWILSHTDQAEQMGKRGQERARSHFSAERMADETLSLYSALLRSSDYGLANLS
jgi:glycosyltransferase involved in cell wall biosynthesis